MMRKQKAADENGHNDDICSLKMSCDRKTAVTGGYGVAPAFHAWNVEGEPKSQTRCKLPKGSREISACSISACGTVMGCVDKSNDHFVYFFKVADGSVMFREKGDQSNHVADMAFSQKKGEIRACTVGSRHCIFWEPNGKGKEKSIQG